MDFDKIIREKWTSSVRRGYVDAEGFMMPLKYQELRHNYDNLEVNEKDIWICTYPKCGTTWTQEMIWLIANNLDFETAKNIDLDDRFPFLEYASIIDFNEVLKNNPSFFVPDYFKESTNVVRSQKSPAFIKTHLPIQLFPKQIKDGLKKPKIVYVVRDPKDVCVSFFHHSRIIDGFRGSFEEYCELFLVGKVLYGSFWDHVLPFWKIRHQSNILFLRYEDMKKNLPPVLKQIAKFLNRSLTNDDTEKLVKHLNFDTLKNNDAVNKKAMIDLLKKVHEIKDDTPFMRKGVAGDHKAAMSPEMIKKFDDWIEKNTRGTGYVV